jgi:hypothetical protein
LAQTLANLRLESQQRANQENKTLVATSEWNRYINLAMSELYDLVISVNPHYYVSSSPFTLTSTNSLDLTSLSPLFYKLRGLDYLPSTTGRAITLHPFNFAERNKQGYRAYAIEGTKLTILPNTNFAGPYTVWYTPVPPSLVIDGDTLDSILDVWAEYITVTVAIVAGIKEESQNLQELMALKQGLIERMAKAASNRDGEPAQAADLMSPSTAVDMDLWY